jgi:type IV secretory pathway VirB2 component (pilin)
MQNIALRHAGAIAVLAVLFVADPALAQSSGGQGDLTSFLQNIVNLITGTAGQILAVIAICLAGIACLFGAMNTRQLGATVLGIMLIFSSAWMVDQIVA